MRINNISAKTSFGRVVKVNSISNPGRKRVPVDRSTLDIANVLNGNKTERYSEEEGIRIRKFFKKALGDYNGKNAVVMRKIGKDVFLLSGEDAAKYRKYIENQTLKAEQYTGRQKKKFLSNAYTAADKRVLKWVEDGENNGRTSSFEFVSYYLKPKNSKQKKSSVYDRNPFRPREITLEEFVGLESIDVKFNKIIYDSTKVRPSHQAKRKHFELEI